VIGVPLPSEEYPDCRDALLSMIRMPSRMPVLVPGIGKSGLVNAAVAACRMVSWARCGREGNVEGRLNKFLDEKTAKPEQDIDLNAQEAEK
jgi:phosphoribosylcarboxyaminoimidazole (NCAIR) mutase